MIPRELCDDHDVPIDEYGCWVCGHAGPITEPARDSYLRWCAEQTLEMILRHL